jgi:hypothetical protein
MVALDVQKSFDCVHHDILCRKLEIMGIDSTWFLSYLTGRSQVVVANGIQSEVEQIQCGVPQGSLLGPLLYLCYCNDMEMAADCNLILYANDSIILYADSDPKVIENKLANELASINHWLIENKLLLHPDKCEAILFASKRKIKLVKDFVINFNGTNIVGTQHIKYLGSIVENDLSGKEKVNGRLKFLYRYKSMPTRDVRKILAFSLVQCQIDYACTSWYHNLTTEYKRKLQVIQNKMMRFILNLGHREHIGPVEFGQIKFMNVTNRVKQLSLNIVHNFYHKQTPSYLLPYFIRASEAHSYHTRSPQYTFSYQQIKIEKF